MIVATAPALRRRVHAVITELDVRGEIDEHASMCLHNALDFARSSNTAVELILVDLRDLTAITTDGLALFARHSADCRAHGLDLGLLIGGGDRDGQIVEAFVRAGLGDRLHHASEAPVRTAAPAVRLLDRARSVRRGRLSRAAGHFSRRRRRRHRRDDTVHR